MTIEALRVRNYRVLRNVHLTKMPHMAVFVGANGSGKSTLLDVFAFLQECVVQNVYGAVRRRGGADEVFSRDSHVPMLIEIDFRFDDGSSRLRYALEFDRQYDTVRVISETLAEFRPGTEEPYIHMAFAGGKGFAVEDVRYGDDRTSGTVKEYEFSGYEGLALDSLGRFKAYPLIAHVRQSFDAWRCTSSLGQPVETPRMEPAQETLDPIGGSVVDFAHHLQQEYRPQFDTVVRRLRRFVPGLEGVETYETPKGEVAIRFRDRAFEFPFRYESMSEGTRKLLGVLLLLNEPEVHPLLTYEEPENDLYPKVMWPLVEEFRSYADRGSQVLISTHSPDFMNALNLDEVYWIEKRDGYATVVRAADDRNVRSQNEGGGLMGSLWTEGFFGKAHPR